MSEAPTVGIVVIGRNEGERLVRSLRAATAQCGRVVYVDSGSSDGSVESARALGVDVVELDDSRPHTAARGRNAGLDHLTRAHPELALVQFLDGDCVLAEGWIDRAARRMAEDEGLGIVFARRREVHPGASIYNTLCDIEWDGEPGPADACGGDVMMRVAAFRQAGGYDPTMIAGEDPELCFRILSGGWRVERMPGEMTAHDADMHRFSQWWRRNVRAGHAFAEGHWKHRRSPGNYCGGDTLRILAWSLGPLALTLAATVLAGPAGLLMLLIYPANTVRMALGLARGGLPAGRAWLYATALTVGRFAELQGVLLFHWRRLRGKERRLVEYKGAAS